MVSGICFAPIQGIMDEEDDLSVLDFNSPKGQLIKVLEQKCKKPEIDNSLGKVLDKFAELTNEQTTLLENGIFHMNFAEDALLLQSCGQYYGKCVDKLWDELLQFHTRMVQYDSNTVKDIKDKTKKEARQQELSKLEERLNRNKRKKISLVEPEAQTSNSSLCNVSSAALAELFDGTGDQEEEELAFDHNDDLFDEWRTLERSASKKKESEVVMQYCAQKYRLKNYPVPGEDNIVYDIEDPEEFNTRQSRLPSYHHLRHLFEYNDRCLLPDEDFTIAKLRLAYIGKRKYLLQKNISSNAPYETYKEGYEQFKKDFFDQERRKIQNMPQKDTDDLRKLYEALEKKEQEALQAQAKLKEMGVKDLPKVTFETLILEPLKEGYEGDYNSFVPVEDDANVGDHEGELSDLFIDLQKLPSSSASDKLRSDSGYFDGGFEADDETDHEDHSDNIGNETPFEMDKRISENDIGHDAQNEEVEFSRADIESEKSNEMDTSLESDVIDKDLEPDLVTTAEEMTANEITGVNEKTANETTGANENDETLPACAGGFSSMATALEAQGFTRLDSEDVNYNSFLLDHSYFRQTDDMVMVIYNKYSENRREKTKGDYHAEIIWEMEKQVKRRQKNEKKIIVDGERKKDIRNEELMKRKLETSIVEDPPPKRRKLSKRQIEKLRRSLIDPVKELKWEFFFSMNYQPESGEGEVLRVEYESESENEDDDSTDLPSEDHNVSGYHSDHDGSHLSDHDYCIPESPVEHTNIEDDNEPPESKVLDKTVNHADSVELLQKEGGDAPSPNDSGVGDVTSINLLDELNKERSSLDDTRCPQPESHICSKQEQEREKLRERVLEWKEHIMPKLKKLEEHDFDIHEYGSKIMNSMSVNESRPFGGIVQGKSSAEVVRYFISSLQLANTQNVEICGARKGELSNDTFHLKLINKERYHEHLQEYQAPSEEGLSEKLKKVRQIKQNKQILSNQSMRTLKRKPAQFIRIPTAQRTSPNTYMKPKELTVSSPVGDFLPAKRIKVLSCRSIKSPSRNNFTDFTQPSTSRQAVVFEQQNQLESSTNIMSPPSQTPRRSSIDSGFMPSCDEDSFLDVFDHLQQNNDTQIRSTPRKIHHISYLRNSNM